MCCFFNFLHTQWAHCDQISLLQPYLCNARTYIPNNVKISYNCMQKCTILCIKMSSLADLYIYMGSLCSKLISPLLPGSQISMFYKHVRCHPNGIWRVMLAIKMHTGPYPGVELYRLFLWNVDVTFSLILYFIASWIE